MSTVKSIPARRASQVAAQASGPANIDRADYWRDIRPDWTELGKFLADQMARSEIATKYEALRAALIDAINMGKITSENVFPTEQELTAVLPVGLSTVQRALKSLVAAGLIARKPGLGTIIVPVKWQVRQPLHVNIQDTEGNRLPVTSRVLSRRLVTGDGRWRGYLPNATQPLVIERLHLAGSEVRVFSEYYVDAGLYPIFRSKPRADLSNENLRHIFMRELGVVVDNINTRISLASAEAKIAKVLQVAEGAMCILERTTATSQGEALYYAEFWIPSSPYELVFDSTLKGLAEV